MSVPIETFAESLVQLRHALANADPFAAAAGPEAADVAHAADAVITAFKSAPADARLRYLLRALDDAIAGLEVAARLADDLYAYDPVGQQAATGAEVDALRYAYNRFAESQTAYQALYHFRNALAEQLRIEVRPLPVAVGDGPSAEAEAPQSDTTAPPPDKKPRTRKARM